MALPFDAIGRPQEFHERQHRVASVGPRPAFRSVDLQLSVFRLSVALGGPVRPIMELVNSLGLQSCLVKGVCLPLEGVSDSLGSFFGNQLQSVLIVTRSSEPIEPFLLLAVER